MARLEGERKSPVPLLVGAALLALLAVGGYYAYQNRGADAVSMAPGEVNVIDNKPGNMASNGDVDASREGNTVTVSGGADSNGSEGANNASDSVTSSEGASAAGGSTAATSGSEATGNAGDANADNAGNTASSSGSDGQAANEGADATSAGAAPDTASDATTGKTGKGVVAERSKTIKNDKSKTTVTYQKKIHQDGTVSHSKTTSGTGAASSVTPAAQ